MSLRVEVMKRAVRDLHRGTLPEKESSLFYFNSKHFVDDCKATAIDHLRVRNQVKEAMEEEGARREYMIKKITNELNSYS